jgi:hypothetical protein
MASIQLTREEAELGFLPDVCMRCGAPATVRKRRMFVSHPFWVYVLLPFGYLPYVIVAAILTRRARCYTHFCPKHKNHWLVRALFIWGAFVAMLVGIGTAFAVLAAIAGKSLEGTRTGFSLCLGSYVLILCWLVLIPVIQATAIHTGDVTDRRLTLKRVSPAFVEAVRDNRDRPRAEDAHQDAGHLARPRASEPSQDVYDPERRRPIDPESDAFEAE